MKINIKIIIILFIFLIQLILVDAKEKKYEKGTLVKVVPLVEIERRPRVAFNAGAGETYTACKFHIKIKDITYITFGGTKTLEDWVIGDLIEIRFKEKGLIKKNMVMYLKRSKGRELKTYLVESIRG